MRPAEKAAEAALAAEGAAGDGERGGLGAADELHPHEDEDDGAGVAQDEEEVGPDAGDDPDAEHGEERPDDVADGDAGGERHGGADAAGGGAGDERGDDRAGGGGEDGEGGGVGEELGEGQRHGRVRVPSGASGQKGFMASSQTWPSGSAK